MTVAPPPTASRPAVLVGLIGQGVAPSLTPPMHELEGARHGMTYIYRTVEITAAQASPDCLAQLLWAARRMGFDGLNVTHPAKQAIVPLLDDLAPSAARVGACNTVVFDGERMIGHNTDVTGFGSAFDAAFGSGPRERVVVVGAGGAGSAVVTALAQRDIADLVIVDVARDRADRLAAQTAPLTDGTVHGAAAGDLPRLLAGADGVVNATPFGMSAHPGMAFDPALLPPEAWVGDIVYRPTDTALLLAARARGLRTMSGLGMAMGQAADAFEIFTGAPADRVAMTQDLKDLVAAEAVATAGTAGNGREEHP